jgi:small ligand-binding sensory domain FIST
MLEMDFQVQALQAPLQPHSSCLGAGRRGAAAAYPTRTDCLLLRFRTVVGVVAVGLILERGVARGERPLGASFLFTSAYRVVLQNASFFYELIGEL